MQNERPRITVLLSKAQYDELIMRLAVTESRLQDVVAELERQQAHAEMKKHLDERFAVLFERLMRAWATAVPARPVHFYRLMAISFLVAIFHDVHTKHFILALVRLIIWFLVVAWAGGTAHCLPIDVRGRSRSTVRKLLYTFKRHLSRVCHGDVCFGTPSLVSHSMAY
jgi:hypothetical protein